MSWTKRQLITQAYEEIGLADYVFDLSPEQFQSACRRMDAMVATWDSAGVRINFPMSDSPDTTNIDVDTGVPGYCIEAIYMNLAVRLGASIGKNISPDTRSGARSAYLAMIDAIVAVPNELQYPSTMPRGQGKKPWRTNNSPYFIPEESPLESGTDGEITFE